MPKAPPDRLKIRDEVVALKRERTLGAAVDLFYEKGYDNTTLDEVAERLGVTKPFIYANFSSKTQLLAAICSLGVEAASDTLEDALSQRLGATDTLRLFAGRYVTAILKVQKYIAVYVREEKNLEPADARRIGAMRREFFGSMTKLIERGSKAGEFDVDDAHVASLGIGGAVTWSTFWYRPDGRLTLTEIAESMTKLILTMVGADIDRDRRPGRADAARARARREIF